MKEHILVFYICIFYTQKLFPSKTGWQIYCFVFTYDLCGYIGFYCQNRGSLSIRIQFIFRKKIICFVDESTLTRDLVNELQKVSCNKISKSNCSIIDTIEL